MIYTLKIKKVRTINSIILKITSLIKTGEYSKYFLAVFYNRKLPDYIFIETDDYRKFVEKIGIEYFTIIKDPVKIEEFKSSVYSLEDKPKEIDIDKIKEGDIVIMNKSNFKNNKEAIVKSINYKTKKAVIKLIQPGNFPFSITIDISNLTLVKSNQS